MTEGFPRPLDFFQDDDVEYYTKIKVGSKDKPSLINIHGGTKVTKWKLPKSVAYKFWKKYNKWFRNNGQSCGLAQVLQNKEIPLLIDVDMKADILNNNTLERNDLKYHYLYNINEVKILIRLINKVLDENLLDKNRNINNYKCILLQKKCYPQCIGNDHYVKNGFHLHYPFLYIQKKDIKDIIIPKIKKTIINYNDSVNEVDNNNNSVNEVDNKDNDWFGKRKIFNSVKDPSSVIDSSHLNQWLLYGSTKKKRERDIYDPEPYLLRYKEGKEIDVADDILYDKNVNGGIRTLKLEEFFKDYKLCYYDTEYDRKGFYNFTKQESDGLKFDKEKLLDKLPQILDVNCGGFYLGVIDNYIRNVKRIEIENIGNIESRMKVNKRVYNKDLNIEKIEELMECLSRERAKEYSTWIQVGFMLHNVFNGTNKGFELFNKFSSLDKIKWDEKEVIKFWESMENKKHTISLGSLDFWAKNDDKEVYDGIIKKYSKNNYTEFIEYNSHLFTSNLLISLSEYQHICEDNNKNKDWYKFDEKQHIWLRDSNAKSLRKIFDIVIKELKRRMKLKIKRANEDNDDNKGKKVIAGIKLQYKDKINKCGNDSWRNGTIRVASDYYHNEDFIENKNTNPNIICFNNGVYDLENLVFRNGRPDDYLTKKMPINFYKDYNPKLPDDKNDPKQIENMMLMHEFFDKIFPDKELRNYWYTRMAYIFQGGNIERIAQFWTGTGCNGKSKTQDIIQYMLGSGYFRKLSTSIITGKKVSRGNADPDLSRCSGGVRWVGMEEPNENERINIGVLKQLTGNDSLACRELYQRGVDTREFKPLFKFTFVCNKLPKIMNPDKAVFDRIKVIPFETEFKRILLCKNCENKFKHKKKPKICPHLQTKEQRMKHKIFKCDINIDKYLKQIAEGLANFLIWRYKDIKLGKINTNFTPKKVKEATDAYNKREDQYSNFKERHIIKDHNATGNNALSETMLYEQFKIYFNENCIGQIPAKPDIISIFNNILGKNYHRRWEGYRIKTDKESINGIDIILGPENNKNDTNEKKEIIEYENDEEENKEIPDDENDSDSEDD